MAQRVEILLEDDLDGGTAAETVRFGLDGTEYEIDLSTENASRFRSILAPFVASARKASRRRRPPTTIQVRSSSDTIRKWAQANGHQVSSRGRIPADIQEAFAQAH